MVPAYKAIESVLKFLSKSVQEYLCYALSKTSDAKALLFALTAWMESDAISPSASVYVRYIESLTGEGSLVNSLVATANTSTSACSTQVIRVTNNVRSHVTIHVTLHILAPPFFPPEHTSFLWHLCTFETERKKEEIKKWHVTT